MKTRIDVHLTFDGPFNVGSGAIGGSLADKPLIRDARGLPMVPASAFKGRLRHEVERLAPILCPDDPPPCGSPRAETMCQGDAPPCPVCRLFGSPWHPGRLTFSDFTLVEPAFLLIGEPPPGHLRYGVGLSRQRRVAEDQLLYTVEVFLPGTPITLSGTIQGDLENEDLVLLKAALENLLAVGGGKTKGLGWFEMAFHIHREPEPAPPAPLSVGDQDEVLEVIVQLDSPLLLGPDADEAFYKTTRSFIPGSVLRGSLARQMTAACEHDPQAPHEGCDFGRLFDDGPAPIFEHLYPTTSHAWEFPFPAPLTARSCKYHPGFVHPRAEEEGGHGVGDILIPQAVFEAMLDRGLPLPALYRPRCPRCGAEVVPFDAFLLMIEADRFDSIAVPIRRTSHTAINRQRAVAADGLLYTLETIEPLDHQRRPTTFRGRVRASPAQIAILAHWLPRLSALGRGQTRGLGHVHVQVKRPEETPNPLPLLETRLRDFNTAFCQEWAFYERVVGAEPLPDDLLFFSLDLLSPAALTWHGVPVTAPPPAMLGFEGGVHLQRAFARYQMVGGWHLGAGLPRRTRPVVVQGSVFLYRCQGLSLEALAAHLAPLETQGLGEDRGRGFGRLLICSPFHYKPEVTL